MKNIKLLLPLIIALILTIGCKNKGTENNFQNNFTDENAKGLYANGQKTFQYNDELHQMATNSKKNMFRYQTHDQSVCVNITLSKSQPAKGTSLILTVDSQGVEDVPSAEYRVVVIKKQPVNDENLMWLWCDNNNTGFILPDPN